MMRAKLPAWAAWLTARLHGPLLIPPMPHSLFARAAFACAGLAVSTCALAQTPPAPASAADKAAAKKAAPAKAAPAAAAPRPAPVLKNPYAALKKPLNPNDLLKNLQVVLTYHLLVEERFYEEPNVLRTFGAERMRWFKLPRPALKSGRMAGFGKLFEPASDAHSADLLLKIVPKDTLQKRRGLAGIEVGRDNRLDVAAVRTVFGDNAQVIDPHQNEDPARALPRSPGTHPLGNKVIVYEFDGAASKGSLKFTVSGDGTIASITAIEEEKNWSLAPIIALPPPPPKAPPASPVTPSPPGNKPALP